MPQARNCDGNCDGGNQRLRRVNKIIAPLTALIAGVCPRVAALATYVTPAWGVIQVTPKDSSTYEEGGSLDETSIDKDVTAVARLSFNIK